MKHAVLSVCLSALTLVALAQESEPARPVGPGVTYFSEKFSTGPLSFNVLKVDLSNPHIHIEAEQGKDRLFTGAPVTEISKRESKPLHAVVGGVNADFWRSTDRLYMPVGLEVGDGTIWSMPSGRSVVYSTVGGEVGIARPTLKITLSKGTDSLDIPAINAPKPIEKIVLYTQPYGDKVQFGSGEAWVLKLAKKEFLPNQPVQVTVVSRSKGPSAPLKPGTVVLWIAADAKCPAGLLKEGSKLELSAAVPEIKGVIAECIGGQPRIVKDGKVFVDYKTEGTGEKFSKDLHPRTAVGLTADHKTLYLVTVDGRQPSFSVGSNLYDLGAFMVNLGCSDAMNMDGGGSTSMVARGKVMNKPSDLTGPRSVANALLVVSNAPVGPLAELEILPSSKLLRIPGDSKVSFTAQGFDASFNPVPVKGQQLQWSADSGVGTIRAEGGNGVLQTAASGQGKVTVKAGNGAQGQVAVSVLPVEELKIEPEVLVLERGETADLKVTALAGGKALAIEPDSIALKVADKAVSASATAVQGVKDGKGEVVFTVGKKSVPVKYFVGDSNNEVIVSFDKLSSTALTGTSFDATKSGVSVEENDVKQGIGALKFDYAMKRGGSSRLVLPIGAKVEKQPAKFGMWIFGDGKEAWVRGDVEDSAGNKFALDFTEGSKGVYWTGWKHRAFQLGECLTPKGTNPHAVPKFPITIQNLSISQDQEILKKSGTLLMDGLEAIYPPPAQ